MAERFPGFESLTSREADVLACLVEDLSNNEIANRLFLSVSTVKWYVRQLNSKLSASNRHEIVDRARALGLLASSAPKDHPPKHNLPAQLTPFVGRDAELDEIAQSLRSCPREPVLNVAESSSGCCTGLDLCAVGDHHDTVEGVDTAATVVSGIAGERSVGHCEHAVVVDAAAGESAIRALLPDTALPS